MTTEVELHPYQEQRPFLDDEKRYYGFVSGIGAGKTFTGLCRTSRNIFEWNPGEPGMIIAPTVPSLRNVIIPEVRKWGLFDIPGANWRRSEKTLELPNGSTIIFESADNDRKIERLRGPSLAWFWMDEAAVIAYSAWKIMIGRLRAGEYQNAFVTTTPKGFNWVYDRFGPDQEDAEFADVGQGRLLTTENTATILQVPSTANPHNPEAYEEITDEYEGRFYEQEVLGKFVQFEGRVYPWFDRATHVVDDVPENIGRVFYAVDWGFRGPAAMLAIAETRTGEIVVLEEFYESRMTVNELVRIAEDMQQRWMPGPFYCDSAEPASIEEFQRAGLDAQPAVKDVTPGIQKVTSLQGELFVHASCQNLINEFGMYRYQDGDENEDPVKMNDHALDALRYGLMTDDSTGALSLGVASGDMY